MVIIGIIMRIRPVSTVLGWPRAERSDRAMDQSAALALGSAVATGAAVGAAGPSCSGCG